MADGTPQIGVQISGFCSARDERGREYTIYFVEVFNGEQAWIVYRRYANFFQLSEVLHRRFEDLPPCPPKKLFGTFTSGFLESRMAELDQWLQQLLMDGRVLGCAEFQTFLCANANTPPPGIDTVYPRIFVHSDAHECIILNEGEYEESENTNEINRNDMDERQDEWLGMSSTTERVTLDDFVLLKVIGKGSFGKVMQVRKKDTGKAYAMKVLRKDNIVRRNQVEHTKTERNVLGYVKHPFIVKLNYAFQTDDKLYFVLDYCAGGELFHHLGREGRFTEERAKYYAAEIASALEYLHGLNIIYRDLKPENVLLDHLGHVCLTDFGLSKEGVTDISSGASSFCGTPEYLAPEILNRQGHGRAVDWWSLGALLYEMLTGLPPFYCRDRERLFEQIRRGTLTYPRYLSLPAKSLLQGLLTKDPARRLGCGPNDADEIKEHEFFADIDWEALANKRITPPFVPDISSSVDTSHIDREFLEMAIHSPVARMGVPVTQKFEGFSYTDPGLG